MAIQLGRIADVGMAARKFSDSVQVVSGTAPQSVNSFLQALDMFLQIRKPVVITLVMPERTQRRSQKAVKGVLVPAVAGILGKIVLKRQNAWFGVADTYHIIYSNLIQGISNISKAF